MTGGPYESISGWQGPLRVTLTALPFVILLCAALVAALGAVRHTPANSQQA
jgi:hypothetical protein